MSTQEMELLVKDDIIRAVLFEIMDNGFTYLDEVIPELVDMDFNWHELDIIENSMRAEHALQRRAS